eukprot:TRINITY_DN95965_c0_g1_i1.p1 TRINITY_DN95965_c0_g1~~TRINITY_DN95965_c0_g1_i1.p1  ORF type:complete len:344 (-),score=67.42 TRINITY_DN95965_c0_g1_i1:156-1187(-)
MPAKNRTQPHQAAKVAETKTKQAVQAVDKKATKAAPQYSREQAPQRVPISWRMFDFFFVLSYLVLFFVILVVFVARCDKIMPNTGPIADMNVKEIVCPAFKNLEGFLGTALTTYKGWVDKVYSVKSSLAMTCAHRLNTWIVGPLSLYLAYAFLVGAEGAKNWAMIHACTLFCSIIIQGTVGWHALLEKQVTVVGADASTFFMVTFGFVGFFPIAVLARVWTPKPFSMEEYSKANQVGFLDRLLTFMAKMGCWVWLFAALITYYEFCVKNLEIARGMPSVADHSAEIWAQTAPHREVLMQQTAAVQDAAMQLGSQAAKAAGEAAENLGTKIVEAAKGMQGNQGQ